MSERLTTEHPFIVRTDARRASFRYVTAPRLSVRFAEVTTTRKTGYLPGLGDIVESRRVGWDHSRLLVTATKRDPAEPTGPSAEHVLRRSGLVTSAKRQVTANSTEGVAAVVRRLSDVDVQAIAACDAEIDRLEELIRVQRRERAAIVDSSWRRAKKMLVHELRPLSDDEPRVLFE